MQDSLFRALTVEEEHQFRQWARDNYTPGSAVEEIWHPVVRDECAKMNAPKVQLTGKVLRGDNGWRWEVAYAHRGTLQKRISSRAYLTAADACDALSGYLMEKEAEADR